MLDKAIELAKIAHEGQVDKGGQPYIGHPLRVMNAVETIEEKIVAVLHDAVEDSDLTLEDLRRSGFSEEIVDAIAAITKREGEKRKDYLKRVESNKIALRVKIADMTDNADISRIPNPTDRDRERTRIYRKNIIKLARALYREETSPSSLVKLQKKLKNYDRQKSMNYAQKRPNASAKMG